MGMIKVTGPDPYNFHRPVVERIKIARAGLYGNDFNTFVKTAGLKIAEVMRKVALHDGEVPIYLIALGADEYFGPNRNGDAFTERTCIAHHDTFRKHARWYRNHKNKDKAKSYGVIKYSWYNPKMHRVELLVALNGTKEAARRNGGLVADKELEKLASGKENWAVSMACKVAYDVCSMCGNKSKSQDDYCTEDTCPGGGCKDNMCKVADDGSITYVDNPNPIWFDISDVIRPADRIAYVFGEMRKAAAAQHAMGGAAIAEALGLSVPVEVQLEGINDATVREHVKLAYYLSELEEQYSRPGTDRTGNGLHTNLEGLSGLGRDDKQRSYILKALANEKIALSLPDFIQFMTECDRKVAEKVAAEVAPALPGLFGRMTRDTDELADDLRDNPFRPSRCEPPARWAKWAYARAPQGSLDPKHSRQRGWLDSIRGENVRVKCASAVQRPNPAAEGFAKLYGLYKLAFLSEIRSQSEPFELTADSVIRQNYIT